MRALIVCGGLGTRLRPYTTVIPKPLLPLGQETLLERQISLLLAAGFSEISVALHYLPELFEGVLAAYMRRMNVSIQMIHEQNPMGTFGTALQVCRDAWLADRKDSILVMNADIVSDINLREFHAHFEQNSFDMLVVANDYQCHIPYGVLHVESDRVLNVQEKPSLVFQILAGIYMLRPRVATKCTDLSRSEIGVDDVMRALLQANGSIGVYRHTGKWIDAGTPSDLERANKIFFR